jgi:Tfp pilus assembly protein PilF
MISYSEGLAYLDKEEYREAWEKFQEAINFDPNYSRAKLKADSIYPLIASGTTP